MQQKPAAPYGIGQIPNPYMAYGGTSGLASLADEAGVYLPTGPGDAQRMELLNMPGDGSDVWLDARAVQLCLQISNTSIYKLIHAGEIPAVKLGTKTIRVNRRALEGYLQRGPEAGRLWGAGSGKPRPGVVLAGGHAARDCPARGDQATGIRRCGCGL